MTHSTVSDQAGSGDNRRLVYVRAADLDRWQCRPLETVDILDLEDRPVGHLDGIVIDRRENLPVYLVIARRPGVDEQRQNWFLVPVGDAWFDDTQRAVRIDAPRRERLPFDPDEFERMTPDQADEYERRVLATCCPEVGFHRDGRPHYARLQAVQMPGVAAVHWRGRVPLTETLEALQSLARSGDIRHWGVSNFDTSDMDELVEPPGGLSVATNQVLYNLARRGIEFDLLPWCRARRVPVMAYSPIDQGRLLRNATVRRVAVSRHASPTQVALAWVLRQEGVLTIPKGSTADHVRENRAALDVHLTQKDLDDLDREFPASSRQVPLEVL